MKPGTITEDRGYTLEMVELEEATLHTDDNGNTWLLSTWGAKVISEDSRIIAYKPYPIQIS